VTNRIQFNADFGHILGVDLGRTRLRVYLTNLAADIIAQATERFTASIDLEKGLRLIAQIARQLVSENLGSWKSVRGIGMGIPSLVNWEATEEVLPARLRHWSDTDISNRLREYLELGSEFPIHLDNDANMGALGESRYGKGRDVRNMIYLKLSTSISAGLILNGEPYRGERGVAGEFGHTRIQFGEALAQDSPVCPFCGAQGCFETLYGLRAVIRRVHSNPASTLYRSKPEDIIKPEHMAEIILEARRGDIVSRAVLEDAGTQIGVVIGSYLLNVYNPALILLDGGMMRPVKEGQAYENTLLLEKLKQSAEQSCLSVAWTGTSISLGQLEHEAVGLGAVATVIDRDPELNISTAI
jgi:predicted NBD/HSP70 family sugar kinase